mgnify:CR=1 FL=1
MLDTKSKVSIGFLIIIVSLFVILFIAFVLNSLRLKLNINSVQDIINVFLWFKSIFKDFIESLKFIYSL